MKKTFTHEFEDNGEDYLPFNPNAEGAAKITMQINDGKFWLSANQEGYLHLAKMFAELGMRDIGSAYHLHMNKNFQYDADGQAFNFGLLD